MDKITIHTQGDLLDECQRLMAKIHTDSKYADSIAKFIQGKIDNEREIMLDDILALKPSEYALMTYFSRLEANGAFLMNCSLLDDFLITLFVVCSRAHLPMSGLSEVLASITNNAYLKRVSQVNTAHGGINHGQMYAAMFPFYVQCDNVSQVVFDSALMEELQHTDISKNIPIHMIKSPFDSVYIQFGDRDGKSVLDDDYYVWNDETGKHALEGVIIQMHNPKYDSVSPDTRKRLGVADNTPLHSMDIMFLGSPKANALDDATSHFTFVYPAEDDEPLAESLKKCLHMYTGMDGKSTPMPQIRLEELTLNMDLLAKCLVYLNCADCRRSKVEGKTQLRRQFDQITNVKKKRRLAKQLHHVDDYILIQSTSESPKLTEHSDSNRKVRAHWRRGHLRMQRYGEGRSLQKLIHIKPMLIGMSKDATVSDLNHRKYKVR